MFKVQVDDDEYEVTFQHFPKGRGKGTTCKIKNSFSFYKRGATLLHPKDNYNYNIGRKLSLARALKKGFFTKDDRKLFWDKYFVVRGKVN